MMENTPYSHNHREQRRRNEGSTDTTYISRSYSTEPPRRRSMEPVYITRSMSEALSTDELSTDERSSSMDNLNNNQISSGRSTPSFRKRPKKPNITLSKQPVYKDFVEILRKDSITSLDSEMDRYSFISDNSYIDILTENERNNKCKNNHEDFEETLRESTPTELSPLQQKFQDLAKICEERPDSPTSALLLPILISDIDNPITALYVKLSPLLRKLKTLDEESKILSSLKLQIARLEKENENLYSQNKIPMMKSTSSFNKEPSTDSNLMEPCDSDKHCGFSKIVTVSTIDRKSLSSLKPLNNDKCIQINSVSSPELYRSVGIQNVPQVATTGVQRFLELIVEMNHIGTMTEETEVHSVGLGEGVADLEMSDKSTHFSIDKKDSSTQNNILNLLVDKNTETDLKSYSDKSIGDNVADLNFCSVSTQNMPEQKDTSSQMDISFRDCGTMSGCSTSTLTDCGIGDKVADVVYSESTTQTNITELSSISTQSVIESHNKSSSFGCPLSELQTVSTQHEQEMKDFCCGENKAEVFTCDKACSMIVVGIDANVGTDKKEMNDSSTECNIKKEQVSVGIGDDTINDILCEKCLVPKKDTCVGEYISNENCTISDKLCDCTKPNTTDVGVGDFSIENICCDKCENLQVVSIGVGTDSGDFSCDKCIKRENFYNVASVGVGDKDINETDCEKCISNDTDNAFDFDVNILNNRPRTPEQQAVLCHYCGNKVDLNDSNLEDSLQAMRDNMKSISCGMKRSTATKNLSFDIEIGDKTNTGHTSVSDDDHIVASEDDYEEDSSSFRNDIIEACEMLHEHFSGQKPLKQPVMMKYVGIIQSLWFKTVKKRRANASVVKSYLDLFLQRIPELLEMIVNLADEEGNTALHYALTYKNIGVASILLDSGECSLDLVNQAGYSPVMLAALVGFDNKNDKYIMQRLFRLGDINKESAENGETALMLAVSRGNVNIIELLLDAGCDINAADDEGSTALMCACEHGNINIVKMLLAHPNCDATIEDNEGSTALSIAMDARRKDLALLVYGSLNFDARGRIKLSPSKQSLLGLGRRSPSPVIGKR